VSLLGIISNRITRSHSDPLRYWPILLQLLCKFSLNPECLMHRHHYVQQPAHEDRSPDLPARSQSLYRLSYPAHNISTVRYVNSDVMRGDNTDFCWTADEINDNTNEINKYASSVGSGRPVAKKFASRLLCLET
jgi:hypothetical protein